MTNNIVSCTPESEISEVVRIMDENDLRIIPVVEAENKLMGLVTKDDICLLLTDPFINTRAFTAKNVMKTKVFSCFPEDELEAAINIMRTSKVKRLFVIDKKGILMGIISLNDILFHTQYNELEEDIYGVNSDDVSEVMNDLYKYRKSIQKQQTKYSF